MIPRRFLPATLLAAAGLLSFHPAGADTLTLGPTCLSRLTVLGGEVPRVISGPEDLLRSRGKTTSFHLPVHDCGDLDSATIQIRRGTDIHLASGHGRTDYTINGVDGDLSGTTANGEVEADSVRTLNLNIHGSGDISLGSATGPVTIRSFSSGNLTLSSLSTPSASIMAMGTGHIRLLGGNIGNLRIRTYGSTTITAHVTAQDADLETLGSGNIILDRVTDNLRTGVFGSGSLHVRNQEGARATTTAAPEKSSMFSDIVSDVMDAFQPDWDATTVSAHDSTLPAPPAPPAPPSPPRPVTVTLTASDDSHHPVLKIILEVLLIIWAVKAWRRYRATGEYPFTNATDRLARGYALFRQQFHQQGSEPRSVGQQVGLFWQTLRTALREDRQYRQAQTAGAPLPAGHPLARLQDRLNRMEPRISRIEHFVTSPEFALERQFHDLEHPQSRHG